MSGYVKLHRKIRENPLFKAKPEARHLFMDILTFIAYAPTVQDWRGTPVDLQAGQAMVSSRELAEYTGFSRQKIRTLLNSLSAHLILKINPLPNQGPMIVSICNWDIYQAQQPTASPPSNPLPTHCQPTKEETKERKKEKEKKDTCVPSPEVVAAYEAYNKTAAECGLPIARIITPDRIKKIEARLKENGIDGWLVALANVEKSKWLCESGRANLDWMLCPKKLLKTIEGNYGNGRHRSATADAKASGKSLFEMVDRNGVRL